MKSILCQFQPAAAAALLCLGLTVSAAETSTGAASAKARTQPAATNAAPAVVEVPKSVFIIPRSPAEGKDPFFPKSNRLWATVVVAAPTTHAPQVLPPQVELQLKGLSGAGDERLAIINNATFAKGEVHEFPTSSGKVPVRCLEIAGDSVVVLVGSEQRTLRLRPGTL